MQGTRKAIDTTFKSWKLILPLVLAAAFAAVSALGPAQLALADAGGVKGHSFDNTFTKWVTSFGTRLDFEQWTPNLCSLALKKITD